MSEPAKYDKLFNVDDYDKPTVEQFADALNELALINERRKYLETLLLENKKLNIFVWTTAEGETRALHNLEDDHLINILQWQVNHGQPINKGLRSEAFKRNIKLPTKAKRIAYDDTQHLDEEYIEW